MAAFSSTQYTANEPPNSGKGVTRQTCHLHTTVSLPATIATADTVNFGYLPVNAVVLGAVLKAQSQMDSNGTPTLTLSMGVTGTGTLWKSAVTTVGRSAGVTGDSTVATAGTLYKTTAKIAVIGTITAGPATGVAAVIECDVAYYVEDAAGSQA